MLGGAYSYNDKSTRVHGQNGAIIPDGETRTLKTYYADLVLKYRGFAFVTDLWDVPVVLLYSPPIRIYRSCWQGIECAS